LFEYSSYPLADSKHENLFPIFSECIDFIDSARQSGAVLVHCEQGISRSATVMIAYLMFIEKLDARAALNKLQDARPQVAPNSGFWKQLKKWEQHLNIEPKES